MTRWLAQVQHLRNASFWDDALFVLAPEISEESFLLYPKPPRSGADLMPWKLESPEQLVKNRSLILRHSVTECKYSSSPDGMWQFEGHVSNLEKLIRIHTQDADPRTVRGDMLSGVYRANKSSSWDKLTFIDPVFVSSKLYKNGKFELELTSGEMARNTAAFLFALDRENRVQVRSWSLAPGTCWQPVRIFV